MPVENLLKTPFNVPKSILGKRKMYKKCKGTKKRLSEGKRMKSFPQLAVENP